MDQARKISLAQIVLIGRQTFLVYTWIRLWRGCEQVDWALIDCQTGRQINLATNACPISLGMQLNCK